MWIAKAVELPGLVNEALYQNELISKLLVLITELLDLNKVAFPAQSPIEIRLHFWLGSG